MSSPSGGDPARPAPPPRPGTASSPHKQHRRLESASQHGFTFPLACVCCAAVVSAGLLLNRRGFFAPAPGGHTPVNRAKLYNVQRRDPKVMRTSRLTLWLHPTRLQFHHHPPAQCLHTAPHIVRAARVYIGYPCRHRCHPQPRGFYPGGVTACSSRVKIPPRQQISAL